MLVIVYLFSVVFRWFADGTDLAETWFSSVPHAMRFLLVSGTIPDQFEFVYQIWEHGTAYAMVYLVFLLVVSVTIMNMLVGILVGVVNAVSDIEREDLMIQFVKSTLLKALQGVDEENGVEEDSKGMVRYDSFMDLMHQPDALRSFNQMGVDVVGLFELADYIFSEGQVLHFSDFMELVMQLRGSNGSTVKDIVDLRKLILLELSYVKEDIVAIIKDEENDAAPRILSSSDFFANGAGTTKLTENAVMNVTSPRLIKDVNF
jgi:hypothetical protein